MRDIIHLFADRDSRDELGLGQIRDALSDALFPGTSTLHTRARYLLLVPWVFQEAAKRPNPTAEVDRLERRLISAIHDSEDYAGLLGMQAGAALKTLPSSIYWSMLRRYHVLSDSSLRMQDALILDGQKLGGDDLSDATRHRFHAWSSTMPRAPIGFPTAVAGGFALRHEEAAWLCERILDAVPGTLMAHFAINPPSPDSQAPWAEPSTQYLSGEAKAYLGHARSFSAVMHGAQLLYNLMLAEQHQDAGFDSDRDFVATYRDELDVWAERLPGDVDVEVWNIEDLLVRVQSERGAPVHPRSVRFVRDWCDLLRDTPPAQLLSHPRARKLISDRERHNKGPQARLGNRRRLQSWGGSSGAGAMTFRWSSVRTILTDIHNGLDREPEPDDA